MEGGGRRAERPRIATAPRSHPTQHTHTTFTRTLPHAHPSPRPHDHTHTHARASPPGTLLHFAVTYDFEAGVACLLERAAALGMLSSDFAFAPGAPDVSGKVDVLDAPAKFGPVSDMPTHRPARRRRGGGG